jgi:protein-disulfide isomerase
MKKNSNSIFFTLLIIFIVIVIGGLFVLNKVNEKKLTEEAKDHVGATYKFNYENQPFIGDKDAPVSMVEFGDFKCPACALWEQKVFPSVYDQYIKTGKVKLYFINYPFIGPDSTTAAIAGESIYHQNPEAFQSFYQAIYKNQPEETKTWATPDYLVKLAKGNVKGIDYDLLLKDINNKKYKNDVDSDFKVGTAAGVQGTPTIFVNGERVEGISSGSTAIGSSPFNTDKIQELIERELKKAGK